MTKAIETLAGADLTAFRAVLQPHVDAVIPPTLVADAQAVLDGAEAVAVAVDADAAAAAAAVAAAEAARDDAVDAAAGLTGALGVVPGSPNFFPLVRDQATGKDLLWFTRAMLDGEGLGPTMRTALALQLIADRAIVPQKAVSSRGGIAVASDGRTLSSWRRKRARIQAGLSGIVRVGYQGHSWAAFNGLAKALSDRLFADLALTSPSAGIGWIPAFKQTSVDTLFTTVGFSSTGAWSDNGVPQGSTSPATQANTYYALGCCGPDGLVTTTAVNGATKTYTNVLCRRLSVYYWDGTGTFKVKIDGADVTPDGAGAATIACAGTNQIKKAVFSGLANTNHTVVIDTTGNTGTVGHCGMLGEDTAITSGVLFLKLGSSGAKAAEYSFLPAASRAYWTTELALDLSIGICTLNDYNQQFDKQYLSQGLIDLMSMGAGGKLLVLEPPCGVSGAVAQSDYRDLALETALAQGWEWVNLFDDWAPYATENTAGAWVDTLHIMTASGATADSNGSARRFANAVCSPLFNR